MQGDNNPLNGQNLAFIEALYAQYTADPSSVEPEWRAYFDDLHSQNGQPGSGQPARLGPSFTPTTVFNPPSNGGGAAPNISGVAERQDRVDQLVRAYRVRGHMIADLDPLGLPREPHPELDISWYGLTEADLDRKFSANTVGGGPAIDTLRNILDRLKRTYCGSIGVQYMHIDDVHIKHWLQERMETTQNQQSLTRETQLRILTKLTDAEIFEQFIHNKFLGAKRFSLEGGESLIPLLDLAIEEAGRHDVEEIVIAMAHRGRLNVLANIMGKSPDLIFREFADKDPDLHFGGGDVKYHLGYSTDVATTSGAQIHLTLCFNPSHLEFVNPVAIGRVRAKQDRRHDEEHSRVMPLLIHGDAAFIGQGVSQETFNLSELWGYRVGGTVHIIVNNQIGFTTPPEAARSSYYGTDIAKMLQIPVIHVNGEHPEAVARAITLAMNFRSKFRKDVVIDMWCYRRYGHNEGDEPEYTQPLMYQAIKKRTTVRKAYLENLYKMGEINKEDGEKIAKRRKTRLETALSESRSPDYEYQLEFGGGLWTPYIGGADEAVPDVETGVDKATLTEIMTHLATEPEDFNIHPKLKRLLKARMAMATGEKPLDWGGAEALAYGSLLLEGTPIRLSGQDAQRGTFSHRHAVWHDHKNGRLCVPVNMIRDDQAHLRAVNSPLSEIGVMGFEYGYSLDAPDQLVIWEAQFGDFSNVAQVITDQFISSSEEKWQRLSGLVLKLPHGFEGQGPEHSSARLERYLNLCAQDNMQVCNVTTPAQIFHLLRRQVNRKIRKPLVIMTPKSLLRLPAATSSMDELTTGTFKRILPDVGDRAPKQVKRVLMCSGKIYYELEQARASMGADHVAIIRLEQLYPLRAAELSQVLSIYAPETEVFWVQEEPMNMGAWPYLRLRFGERLVDRHPLKWVARPESASPATGSAASHKMEQELLIEQAFATT
ncbi:MAG: 2-oxoglutarate dehydrogenase E1 component [Bradymonadia bacterium]